LACVVSSKRSCVTVEAMDRHEANVNSERRMIWDALSHSARPKAAVERVR
jgi:hypothetical protein